MANKKPDLIKRMAEAESYICAKCGYHGYGGWNCNQCGEHDLIHTAHSEKIFSEDLGQYVKAHLSRGA